MTDDDNSPALLGALSSEQFMLQSIASSTISESGTRAAIYLSTLSGGLVAIGFSGSTPGLLAPLVFTVLPTIWLLGWLTVVRLVDTSVENIAVGRRIERIRSRYFTLSNAAQAIFAPEDPLTTGKFGVQYSRWSVLFTTATMVGVVNAVLAGAVVAIALGFITGLSTLAATALGTTSGIAILSATVAYQHRRVGALFTKPKSHTATALPDLGGGVDERIALLSAMDARALADTTWLQRQLRLTLSAWAKDETTLDIETEARQDF